MTSHAHDIPRPWHPTPMTSHAHGIPRPPRGGTGEVCCSARGAAASRPLGGLSAAWRGSARGCETLCAGKTLPQTPPSWAAGRAPPRRPPACAAPQRAPPPSVRRARSPPSPPPSRGPAVTPARAPEAARVSARRAVKGADHRVGPPGAGWRPPGAALRGARGGGGGRAPEACRVPGRSELEGGGRGPGPPRGRAWGARPGISRRIKTLTP